MLKKKIIILCFVGLILVIGIVSGVRISKYAKEISERPMFYSKEVELGKYKEFSLEDYYITNKLIGENRYYIDDNSDLWGYGYNRYGQLGNGQADDLFTEVPFKIASDVVSVDASCNGYFCIYLTSEGELYGMGSNMLGLLGQEYDKQIHYMVEDYEEVVRPVLLMEDVAYARAGRESITALKTDGSVWWWGEYKSTYATDPSPETDNYWTAEEDDNNPAKMLYNSPHKILDDCIYATTGEWRGAAIDRKGDLYMWGLNLFGECGVAVTGDDYIRSPQKVLEDVHMVWPEKVELNSIRDDLPENPEYRAEYVFNTFVQLKDGTLLAAGRGLGDQVRTIGLTGDISVTTASSYSDTFVPVVLKQYSKGAIKRSLQTLEMGTSKEEVEKFLQRHGISYWDSVEFSVETGEHYVNEHTLSLEDGLYELKFDEQDKLNEVYLQ